MVKYSTVGTYNNAKNFLKTPQFFFENMYDIYITRCKYVYAQKDYFMVISKYISKFCILLNKVMVLKENVSTICRQDKSNHFEALNCLIRIM